MRQNSNFWKFVKNLEKNVFHAKKKLNEISCTIVSLHSIVLNCELLTNKKLLLLNTLLLNQPKYYNIKYPKNVLYIYIYIYNLFQTYTNVFIIHLNHYCKIHIIFSYSYNVSHEN
jgi:hypothetical protein